MLARHYEVSGTRELVDDHLEQRLVLRGPGITLRVDVLPGPQFVDPMCEARKHAHVLVVVVDSQHQRIEGNRFAVEEILKLPARPMVFQFNKRDLRNAMPLDELQRELNPNRFPAFESIATRGVGTMEAFHAAAVLAAKLVGVSDELTPEFGCVDPA